MRSHVTSLRALAIVLTASFVAACGSSGSGAPPTATPASSAPSTSAVGSTATAEPSIAGSSTIARPAPGATTSPSAAPVPLTADAFGDSSIRVVDDDRSAVPAGEGLVLTRGQIDLMVRESTQRGGVVGADLDRLSPAPAGVVPLSYLIGAWATLGATDGARRTAAAIGSVDYHHAPDVVFPTGALVLFLGDTAHAMASVPAPSGALPFARPNAEAGADAPCSTVANFIDQALSGLFDALRISPTFLGNEGAASALAGFLAGLWNTAVDFAQGVVKGLVSTLSAPVVGFIRTALGVMGVATTMLSYVKDWSLDVRTDPERPDGDLYRFAIGDEADRSGSFVATVPPAAADWPPALKDCAGATGVPLPQLAVPGAPALWKVTYNEGVITTKGALTTPLGSDLTARLEFLTGREPQEFAQGDKVVGTALVSVKVPRGEITRFLEFVQAQMAAAEQILLAQVPTGVLHDQASAALQSFVQPVVDQLSSAVQDQADGLFSLRGEGVVAVTHHSAPEPPTSAGSGSSTTAESGDAAFCKALEATFAWLQQAVKDAADRLNAAVAAGADRKAMEEANVPLGQGMVERYTALRALAPASLLADFDVAIAYGQHLAIPLSGPRDIALQYGVSGPRIGRYGRDVCHIDVVKYHILNG